ncbi:MAG: patatin-like phospholipase family protein [Actinomycetota bacterium]|nr:patatin-like phospholipase family protein [Actinomycetota bacterium]
MSDGEQFADLVFEGGGVKGIAFAGALAALEGRGFTHKSVAGTSAGAITAALVAAGYSSAELDEILLKVPFKDFKDEDWRDRLPVIGHVASALADWGIYEGNFFRSWMAGLLQAKGVTKFGDLVDEEAEDPKHRWRLRVIASDVTHRRMLVLPNDAEHLGVDPDELDIAYAVRMSMSIPIFFEPVKHKNPDTGEEHLIVDGGMLSNFPVWLFDREGREPRWPTFGLLLVEPDPKVPIGHRLPGEEHGAERGSLLDYVKGMALTMMAAHERLYLEKATYARTIPIPTLGIGTTEFDITPERVRALYESGRNATSEFLDHWDFDKYIEEFRRGKEHSRRRDLQALLPDGREG